MEIVTDLAIAAGAFFAAAYCLLLSRRVRALSRLDGDLGKAIALLSRQVDDLTRALKAAEQSSAQSGTALAQHITTAEAAARRLELLMAAHRASSGATVADSPPTSSERPRNPDRQGADFTPLGTGARPLAADTRKRVLRHREPSGGL